MYYVVYFGILVNSRSLCLSAMADTGKLPILVLLLMVYITKHTKLEEKNEANRAAGKKIGDEQMKWRRDQGGVIGQLAKGTYSSFYTDIFKM